jgi:hypothetical protein
MQVIVPLEATLTSSGISEPDVSRGEVVYSTLTTYNTGDQVISTSTHKIYESLQDSNLNKPLPVAPEITTDWWIEVGPTNKYACMDLTRNTQTVGGTSLTMVITPGARINSIALMGLEAEHATILMESGGNTVYEAEYDLRLRRVVNAAGYFFKPFIYQASVVEFDLPPYYNSTITLTFTRNTGEVLVGGIVVGTYVYLGRTQPKAVNDALNFSVVDRDAYGTLAALTPRRSVPKTQQVLEADKSIVVDLLAARTALNAVPAVWSGLDDSSSDGYFEAVLILGIYKQFSINLAYPGYAEVTLELEEI